MKTYTTTVSSRKQTSVPSALGLKGGEKLVWEAVDVGGGCKIFKVALIPENPLDGLHGMLKGSRIGRLEDLLLDRKLDKKHDEKKMSKFSKRDKL